MCRLLLVAVLVSAMPGCFGDTAPVLVDVSGVVTAYGEPLEGATVMFVPVRTRDLQSRWTPIAIGVTDENGRYRLGLANGGSGAPIGTHRVMVSKLDLPEMMRSDASEVNPPDTSSKLSQSDKKEALRRAYRIADPFRTSQPMGEVVFDSFNLDSKILFDVLSSGSSSADFEVGRDPLLYGN